jgi:hypothetical protein
VLRDICLMLTLSFFLSLSLPFCLFVSVIYDFVFVHFFPIFVCVVHIVINKITDHIHRYRAHTYTHTQKIKINKNRNKEKGEMYSTYKMDIDIDIDYTYTLTIKTKVLTSFRHRAVDI